MKQIEIEIKLPIEGMEEAAEKLIHLGFQQKGKIREQDIYFNSEFYDVKKRDEALRIRRSENLDTGESRGEINFKGPKIDTVSMSRKELESQVENPEVVEEILKIIGFSPVRDVEKVRRYFIRENMTACLDQVKDLGDYLELEVLAEEESAREAALGEMEHVLHALGYSMENTTRQSYLSMLEEKDR